ncbi:hypothetical protein GUJ93_ZPchr0003g18006 [Zizania palustris]|uniref:DUF7653 domain-containing protein n=1 Tax=Zizania palustris TaxID=103762 RepID=A0A8J5VL57_ZIZPA|nr:hypothetical protein GUJ93_ZPchr0003g18006 [Zizania palustris]KAG8063572.1 hypothetical protein GUJ93_ZPchr0003g18006 [Zizania palustris]KAG8063573.1 hypothetical protein GUJ93_ZPchr0003g18006 [Zizania palustris]KAG8063574.1 hypothetical protein GUJ93_ZPchr0003g18006 [Zizania palustris]
MRRFFPFRSFTSNAGNGKAATGHDKRNENKLNEGGTSRASHSPDSPQSFRSRSRHGKSRSEESSNPQLRRSMSFTSSAIDRSLDERAMSFSGDARCSLSYSSDAPRHIGDAECYPWPPERENNMGEYAMKITKTHGSQETDSPHSRCYSCSTGHSPVSSPVTLKCRSSRLTNLPSKNEVLDLYIDGEQELNRVNEKHKMKLSVKPSAFYLGHGRPPRPHSTAPSSPKSCKEIIENYSNANIIEAFHHQLAQEETKGTWKIASVCDPAGNNAQMFNASSENRSHLEEWKSQNMAAVEDIYEDLQDAQPPCFCDTSIGCISGTTERCIAADGSFHGDSHGFLDNNLEQETDDMLLRRAKELEACFMVPPADNNELNMLRENNLSSTDMLQLIHTLIEDRKQLALQLSSHIKARLSERFASKEQSKQSRVDLDTRTRRLEKEKSDVQTTLEMELDRRSNDWSVKLARFQSEEQRLRERVRELAEQNVSFQREVTLLESNRVDDSNKITCLELQNKQLSDELQKVKKEHDNLFKSSAELHDNLMKTTEEKNQIQECLKEKGDENRALHTVIARLQRVSNEQEKTIAGLRQGFNAELEHRSPGTSESINRMQKELIRLTGVEQKLRREIQSCNSEVESLREENIIILNRLQRSDNSISSVRLEQELNARVDSLQVQGLSLLDDTSQLCTKLLDLMKSKRSEGISSVDALSSIEYTLNYQSIKERINNLKQSLQSIRSVLTEKHIEEEKMERKLEAVS